MPFQRPIEDLVSEKALPILKQAGFHHWGDVLFHLPIRYEDKTHLTPIAQLRAEQSALVWGKIVGVRVSPKVLNVRIQDQAGHSMQILLFKYYPNQIKMFTKGREGLFYGKALWHHDGFSFHHPSITWLKKDQLPTLESSLTPIYRSFPSISQRQWQSWISKALSALPDEPDPLALFHLLPLKQALITLHQPSPNDSPSQLLQPEHPARWRLIVDELLAHHASIAYARTERTRLKAYKLPKSKALLPALKALLPYQLTDAQERVIQEIENDLKKTHPMQRLVQGDVGSGKTMVAFAACLQAIEAGKQAALMTPTELLAEQHFLNLKRFAQSLDISCVLLSSKQKTSEKRNHLQAIQSGAAQLIIGTHALIQQQVQYHDLALVAIDEQHRFGVHQRLQLQQKNHRRTPHQLILTATPIPRTLAMSHYGELDLSIIDSLPKGRKPIQTSVMNREKRFAIMRRLGELCATGKQAYWVCPLIEESEMLECENAEATFAQLQSALPQVTIGLVHGRMPTAERQATMKRFVDNDVQLLVATTVIEVGVDVPNANIMVIENAERFGLSQLHQLRGRVGRGKEQAHCVLLYQEPLGHVAKSRLNIMRQSHDGFWIAEQDLLLRGAGELLGTRQTGAVGFLMAELPRDEALLPKLGSYFATLSPTEQSALVRRWWISRSQYLAA
ncbi:MAG: ATP-dependent DNA helicase RecG [Cardiobacteriaceae bacterium]|nr:ATP-dependent DNA helicase RecG [Cardiobacteriaceae bacterium]